MHIVFTEVEPVCVGSLQLRAHADLIKPSLCRPGFGFNDKRTTYPTAADRFVSYESTYLDVSSRMQPIRGRNIDPPNDSLFRQARHQHNMIGFLLKTSNSRLDFFGRKRIAQLRTQSRDLFGI